MIAVFRPKRLCIDSRMSTDRSRGRRNVYRKPSRISVVSREVARVTARGTFMSASATRIAA